jgi:hypothetical protein
MYKVSWSISGYHKYNVGEPSAIQITFNADWLSVEMARAIISNFLDWGSQNIILTIELHIVRRLDLTQVKVQYHHWRYIWDCSTFPSYLGVSHTKTDYIMRDWLCHLAYESIIYLLVSFNFCVIMFS